MRGTKQSPAQSHRPVSSESSKLLLDRFRPAGTASGRQYALVLHCTRYIVVQTNLIALCLVKFPESSGETILLSRGNTASNSTLKLLSVVARISNMVTSSSSPLCASKNISTSSRVEPMNCDLFGRSASLTTSLPGRRCRRTLARDSDQGELKLEPDPNGVDIRIIVRLECPCHGSGNMTRSRAYFDDSRSS
jgi:hypothetical protein